MKQVFFLGSHPALSAAEIVALVERLGRESSFDTSRLPVALGADAVPSPADALRLLGGTTMIGTLRATLDHWPTAEDILRAVPEITELRQGKRLIGLSALPCSASTKASDFDELSRVADRPADLRPTELASEVRRLAMELKRTIGMKGTRVVFPGARRPDLSTAQLLHNRLPRDGTVIFFLLGRQIAPRTSEERVAHFGSAQRVDLVTVYSIQDIEAYARRDRGRPHADPGTGMLPPKVAQMMLNLSLVPQGGMVYDPFCGVGTIPAEALLMGLKAYASDVSPKQVEWTRENIEWLRLLPEATLFVHDISKNPPPIDAGSIDAIVTEGWLGPARTAPPLPREADRVFADVQKVIGKLLPSVVAVLKGAGCIVLTVPAFRVGKRILRFPLEKLRHPGFAPDPLVPKDWDHPIFREATRGTLLYGRPDAIVLREIVRFRKV